MEREHWPSWTNISFLIAAILVVWKDPGLWPLWLMALGLAGVAVTSFGYHWTQEKSWRDADVASIYLMLWFLYGYQVEMFLSGSWLYLVPAVAAGTYMAANKRKFSSFTMVPLLVAMNLTLALYGYGPQVLAPLGVLALGGIVRQTHFWWGWNEKVTHGLWHILEAAGICWWIYL